MKVHYAQMGSCLVSPTYFCMYVGMYCHHSLAHDMHHDDEVSA